MDVKAENLWGRSVIGLTGSVCFLLQISPIILKGLKMATAAFLTIGVLYLLGLRRADKKRSELSKEVQGLKEYTTCEYFEL